jgi:cyclic pyranopterin phosphate synthase
MTDPKLTHVDASGRARMVDVGDKEVTRRSATASGRVRMSSVALALVREGSAKGDVLQVARIAGIQGAKRTADLVPLCHPLAIDSVTVALRIDEPSSCVLIESTVRCSGKTGVEMEALTATSVAALTVYDMVKAVDRGVVIEEILLVSKEGGRSGHYERGAGS